MKMILILLMVAFSAQAQTAIKADWKKVKTRKQVDVFKGEMKGSKLVAFKGTGTIDANIVKVISVIRDDNRKADWISDLAETRVLKQINLLEKIEYNRTKTPWPLDDRDFVYNAKVVIHKNKGEVEVLLKSVEHPDAKPKKDVVRGQLHASRYLLRSLEGGKKTYIEVEIFADPAGEVPKWLVNIFQSVWPSNTIDGIRKIAEDPEYKVLADVASYAKSLKQN